MSQAKTRMDGKPDARSLSKHSREARPLGCVVRRADGNFIKFREDLRPSYRNWMQLSRWRWMRAHGAIPAGKVVVHVDGDKWNDELANLALGTVADNAAVWAFKDPAGAVRNHRAIAESTGKRNRAAALLRVQRGEILPTRWYAVRVDDGSVNFTLAPCRSRRGMLDALFVRANCASPRGLPGGWVSRALGFPGMSGAGACFMAALLASGAAPLRRCVEGARRVAASWGIAVPRRLSSWRGVVSMLRRDGFVLRSRRGPVEPAFVVRCAVLDCRPVRGDALLAARVMEEAG